MGATLEAVKGFIPKHHPPAKTLRLCEEILDELRRAEEQTGAGGARALRNAKRAAVGERIVVVSCVSSLVQTSVGTRGHQNRAGTLVS